MEVFYASREGGEALLGPEESLHAARVLRHKAGDEINVIDGEGSLFVVWLTEVSKRECRGTILQEIPGWGSHPYRLTMAVCPTKNLERFEWFAEKAAELGVDRLVPVIGERSERESVNMERLRRVLISACKQSYKGRLPEVSEPQSVRDFIASPAEGLKAIAYCFEGETRRLSFADALRDYKGDTYTVLIGPEGDFSPEEAGLALAAGFLPVHLGSSRLRTETAALTAVEGVYFKYM